MGRWVGVGGGGGTVDDLRVFSDISCDVHAKQALSLKASIYFKCRLPVSMQSSRFEARASIRLAGCRELRSVWLGVANFDPFGWVSRASIRLAGCRELRSVWLGVASFHM